MSHKKHLPKIIIDTREQQPWRFNKCSTCAGSVKAALKTGDYTMEGMEDIFIVERKKSAAELYGNLGTKDNKRRFFNEMDRIRVFKYKFLFLSFSIEDIYEWWIIGPRITRRKMYTTPQYIVSQLIEMEIEYGIRVVFLGSPTTQKGKDNVKQFINRFFYKYYNLHMSGKLP